MDIQKRSAKEVCIFFVMLGKRMLKAACRTKLFWLFPDLMGMVKNADAPGRTGCGYNLLGGFTTECTEAHFVRHGKGSE